MSNLLFPSAANLISGRTGEGKNSLWFVLYQIVNVVHKLIYWSVFFYKSFESRES